MSKETLKALRLIIPGVLIFLLFTPLVQGGFNLEKLTGIATNNAIYIVLVLLAGGIYKTFEARSIFFDHDLQPIHKNIKDRLLAPFANDPTISKLIDTDPRKFLKVFYNIIDNDPSLTQKQKDVFENGLLWSSYADAAVISLFGIPLYVIGFCVTRNDAFMTMIYILSALFLIALFMVQLSVRKHIRLGNDQLDVITTIHRERLQVLLGKLVS